MISLTSFIPEIKIQPNNNLTGIYFQSKILADYQIGEKDERGDYTIIALYPNNKSRVLGISYSSESIKAHFKSGDWIKINKPGYITEIKIQPKVQQITDIDQLYNFVQKNKELVVRTVLDKWNSEEGPDGQYNESSILKFIEEGIIKKSKYAGGSTGYFVKISDNTSVNFSTYIILSYEQEPDWINPIDIKGIKLYYFIEG